MTTATAASFKGFRLPQEIISHAVWLYHRFLLSYRDVEELLAERGLALFCTPDPMFRRASPI